MGAASRVGCLYCAKSQRLNGGAPERARVSHALREMRRHEAAGVLVTTPALTVEQVAARKALALMGYAGTLTTKADRRRNSPIFSGRVRKSLAIHGAALADWNWGSYFRNLREAAPE